jgi:hydrogenase nickel incorporation protein HypA/HybF
MHELSIALSIIDGVVQEAERHGGAQVETVFIRVGRLCGVDKEALLFSYQVASQDTPLVASRLVIEDVPVLIHCPACDGERPAQDFPSLLCAECGTAGERVLRGEELEITRLEIAA